MSGSTASEPTTSSTSTDTTAGITAGATTEVDPGESSTTSDDASSSSGGIPTEPFSFFVTSYRAMQELSGTQDGFGGDFRFGEDGVGAGLRQLHGSEAPTSDH